ncbi:MAG: diaminopimelate decarboxylase [Mariniblastus sp.]|nr:diaminopimelate decarboxylase [Mariniblastus sp.]
MAITEPFAPTMPMIAGVPTSQLAEQFGTPTYVYDAAKILDRIEQLRQFDLIRYAQKANSNLAILDLVRRNGVAVDAVSAGEIHRARRAGYSLKGDPAPVVYTADIFDHAALDLVVSENIHVNLGSPDMISQFGERVESGRITLRINPGFGHGHSQKTNTGGQQSKHGIWHDQLENCIERAAEHGLTVSGLHMHIGSGTDFEHLSQVCNAMKQMARRVGPSIEVISAGGGLPIPYRDTDESVDIQRYYELWDKTRQELQQDMGHEVSLEIEPGRFLVADAGYLVSEIRAVKKMGDNLFYLVDAGFNNLARPIMYGAYHPMAIAHRHPRPWKLQDVVVGGPLCESGDIFTQQEGGLVDTRPLPEAEVGDFLIIQCAGAYGFVMSSNYNSKPFAAEVLIEEGQPKLIRSRQSPEDLYAGEILDNVEAD